MKLGPRPLAVLVGGSVVLGAVAWVPGCTGDDPKVAPSVDAAADTGPTDGASVVDGASADGSVLDGAAADGSGSDTGVQDGGVQDGSNDGSAPLDGGFVPAAGDVVVLVPSSVVVDANQRVAEWKNAVAPSNITFQPAAIGPSNPSFVDVATDAGVPSLKCVTFGGGGRVLFANDNAFFKIGGGDFRFTAVLVRIGALQPTDDHGRVVVSAAEVLNDGSLSYEGPVLMTEHQSPDLTTKSERFAARLSWTRSTQQAKEVVALTRGPFGALEVVTMLRRGAELELRTGKAKADSKTVAAGTSVPPAAKFVLGHVGIDIDPTNYFDGQLCGLVVHVGSEADADVVAREAAFAKQFGL